jgi:hypothetical protein
LKKRTKKLLVLWLGVASNTEPKIKSFLLLFFQKRSPFFAALVSAAGPERPALPVV